MDIQVKDSILGRLKSQYNSSYCEKRQQFVINEISNSEIDSDSLNKVKELAKRRFAGTYPFLIKLLSPVYCNDSVPDLLKSSDSSEFIVNLGSGTHTYPNVINVDGCGYKNVHIIANLEDLPFIDEVVDKVISVAVLEHVSEPAKHVAEFFRILKPGGQLLVFVPFLQPFHASPTDFQRYTDLGLLQLFQSFKNAKVTVAAGPTSALIWVFQEWLAMILSFGSVRLYKMLVPLMWIFSPLKFLDIILARHPAARIAASGFYLTANKP